MTPQTTTAKGAPYPQPPTGDRDTISMTTEARQGNSGWASFLAISIYLIARFLWRIVFEGGSWPLPPWHYVSMLIDVGLMIALIALRPSESGLEESRRGTASLMFWLGILAGVASLLIRFTSDAAWWTGHLRN
jgi:hypothetical protein